MNIIADRDRRTRNRKKMKKAFDKAIDLSVSAEEKDLFRFAVKQNNGTVRLLDEGAIVMADGNLDVFIMRGTIEKYLNGQNKHLDNLTDDYVGSINIGHLDFATFPVGIVGEWTRNDLSLTDNGDERHGLDVALHLNDEHPLIQALKVQGIDVGVSVEMYLHFDGEASKENDIWAVDEIFIADFAIVGECGNVGSSETISLKGGEEMKKTDINLDVTGNDELKEIVEEIEEEMKAEESAEVDIESEGDPEDVDTDDDEEEEEDDEVVSEESDEESEDEEADDEEVEESVDAIGIAEKLMAKVEALEADVDELKKENAELKKSNRKKEKKLKALKEADKNFTDRFKKLAVSFGMTKEESEEETQEVTERRYASGDGIGE